MNVVYISINIFVRMINCVKCTVDTCFSVQNIQNIGDIFYIMYNEKGATNSLK